MALNIYDPDVHNIVIVGARSHAFPLGSGTGAIDSGTIQASNDAVNAAAGLWQGSTSALKAAYYPRLLKIQCMDQLPGAGDTVVFEDNANTVWYTFTFAADAADKSREFDFGGLVLPKGGFGLTITGTKNWMIIFTWSAV